MRFHGRQRPPGPPQAREGHQPSPAEGGTGQGQPSVHGDCLAVTEMGECVLGIFLPTPILQQLFSFTDFHSLDYDFNISSHKQPWCMVQGQMDGEKLFLYDCGSNKVIPMNPPREEGKAMDSCNEALGTLTDVGNELKSLLTDIKQEKYAGGGKCEKPRAEVSRLWGPLYGLHSFKQKTGCWAFFPPSPAERSGRAGRGEKGSGEVDTRWGEAFVETGG